MFWGATMSTLKPAPESYPKCGAQHATPLVFVVIALGLCGCGLAPSSPYYLSPTSTFLAGVEFAVDGELRQERVCTRFVSRDNRNFFDTSPEQNGGGFGNIGPHGLHLEMLFHWERDLVDFNLTRSQMGSPTTMVAEQSVALSALADDVPEEHSVFGQVEDTNYRLFVTDRFDENTCRSLTTL